MAPHRLSIVAFAAVSLCTAALAVEPPEPVSPGSSEQIERIASPCPTFSWASPSGALGIRVAVYQVPADESAPAALVAERELPGAAENHARVEEPRGRHPCRLRSRKARSM